MTTAGESTAERASLERRLRFSGDLEAFLVRVSLETVTGPLLASAGDPLTLGQVRGWWRSLVSEPLSRRIAAYAVRHDDLFLQEQAQRVHTSPMPVRVYLRTIGVLREATEQQWAPAQVRREVGKALARVEWEPAARRIARTEATALHGHLMLGRLEREGYPNKKWVAHHDARTRSSHLAANGQVQPLYGSFEVGGYSLSAPGDPAAPVEETASCRCVIIGEE